MKKPPSRLIVPDAHAKASKKKQIAAMFDAISPRYDLLNRILSLRIDILWRYGALKMLERRTKKDKNASFELLDLATGTADLAIEAARHFPQSQVIGIDISSGMLKKGRQKVKNKQLEERIQLQEGDAEALRFENGRFDAVMSSFGVRNFENLSQGLREMHRVLKVGGWAMILEFSTPHRVIRGLFSLYFQYLLPMIGQWLTHHPLAYRYLARSVPAFFQGEAFLAELKKAGFEKREARRLTGGIACVYMAQKHA